MKSKTLIKTSILPGTKKEVFEKLQEIKTLQYIARPFATFKSVDQSKDMRWEEGKVFVFELKLFGIISFGLHTIKVVRFNNNNIYTNESNTHVPIWNHEIILKTIDGGKLQYTDKVEIEAGWKTPFVYLWALLFYMHRQRKWKKLLSKIKSI